MIVTKKVQTKTNKITDVSIVFKLIVLLSFQITRQFRTRVFVDLRS